MEPGTFGTGKLLPPHPCCSPLRCLPARALTMLLRPRANVNTLTCKQSNAFAKLQDSVCVLALAPVPCSGRAANGSCGSVTVCRGDVAASDCQQVYGGSVQVGPGSLGAAAFPAVSGSRLCVEAA